MADLNDAENGQSSDNAYTITVTDTTVAASDLNAEASRVSAQLRIEAAQLAIEKALATLPSKLDGEAQANLIDNSIKNMGKA